MRVALVYQYFTRCGEYGGEFFDHSQAILSDCSLSPVIHAFFFIALAREVSERIRYAYLCEVLIGRVGYAATPKIRDSLIL